MRVKNGSLSFPKKELKILLAFITKKADRVNLHGLGIDTSCAAAFATDGSRMVVALMRKGEKLKGPETNVLIPKPKIQEAYKACPVGGTVLIDLDLPKIEICTADGTRTALIEVSIPTTRPASWREVLPTSRIKDSDQSDAVTGIKIEHLEGLQYLSAVSSYFRMECRSSLDPIAFYSPDIGSPDEWIALVMPVRLPR